MATINQVLSEYFRQQNPEKEDKARRGTTMEGQAAARQVPLADRISLCQQLLLSTAGHNWAESQHRDTIHSVNFSFLFVRRLQSGGNSTLASFFLFFYFAELPNALPLVVKVNVYIT